MSRIGGIKTEQKCYQSAVCFVSFWKMDDTQNKCYRRWRENGEKKMEITLNYTKSNTFSPDLFNRYRVSEAFQWLSLYSNMKPKNQNGHTHTHSVILCVSFCGYSDWPAPWLQCNFQHLASCFILSLSPQPFLWLSITLAHFNLM